MITAALNALLESYPDASISLLTSPDGNRLLRNFSPAICDIWIWNRSTLSAGLKKKKLAAKIKHACFDKIFCFETSPSIIRLFENSAAEFYKPEHTDKVEHTARLYLNMVEKSCEKALDNYYVYLPVTREATDKIHNELAGHGINKNDIIIAMHPTFSGYSRLPLVKSKARKNKLWPAMCFAELATRLSEYTLKDGSHPKIIIDLLESESALGKKITRLSSDKVLLLTEPANMERYKALLKRVDLLISPDTGPMHIAAAVNTRIVALFSGKSPSDCGPYMPADHFVTLQAENMTEPQRGIHAISVQDVYQACVQQLEKLQQQPDDQ